MRKNRKERNSLARLCRNKVYGGRQDGPHDLKYKFNVRRGGGGGGLKEAEKMTWGASS